MAAQLRKVLYRGFESPDTPAGHALEAIRVLFYARCVSCGAWDAGIGWQQHGAIDYAGNERCMFEISDADMVGLQHYCYLRAVGEFPPLACGGGGGN